MVGGAGCDSLRQPAEAAGVAVGSKRQMYGWGRTLSTRPLLQASEIGISSEFRLILKVFP